jgi:predicted ATPase
VYLWPTGWDDWFKFSTLFNVLYVDTEGKAHPIGHTKIGQFGLQPAGREEDKDPQPGYRSPHVPESFELLDDRFFSLGQDTSYYEGLSKIGVEFRESFLSAMKDIAFDVELLSRAEDEPVTAVSLLRSVPLRTVQEQFARLARGGARLTAYNFTYLLDQETDHPWQLAFNVQPDSRPPTNIHVLIGRNGVGKSTVLNGLANALVESSRDSGDSTVWQKFSNVVSVSFSAFDQFEPIRNSHDRTKGLTYHYIGLKKVGTKAVDDAHASTTKDPAVLSRELTLSAKTCLLGARRRRLQRALRLLESDPVFAGIGLGDLVEDSVGDALDELPTIFRRLSSGHKIVLLTITKLVETVEEKSLVLLDEPEAHLHPPLLSAFVRALSDLLTNRNGMAVVATHSPVVLQEVPRSCVWKLYRSGDIVTAERPQLETFGENVGTLTDEVFGLEVIATGFHKMLADIAAEAEDYEAALAAFDGQLGTEGRAMLRAMFTAMSQEHHVGR